MKLPGNYFNSLNVNLLRWFSLINLGWWFFFAMMSSIPIKTVKHAQIICTWLQYTELQFDSFQSVALLTQYLVVNPPEWKLTNSTSVGLKVENNRSNLKNTLADINLKIEELFHAKRKSTKKTECYSRKKESTHWGIITL